MDVKNIALKSGVVASLVLVAVSTVDAKAGEWSYTGSLRFAAGNYIYSTTTSSVYFFSYLRYKGQRYNLRLGVPLVGQNSNLVSYTGGGMIPRGAMPHGEEEGMMGGGRGGMTGPSPQGTSAFAVALGDVLFSGEYTLAREGRITPSLALSGQIKAPTGSTAKGFSTGAWDYGLGLSFSKSLGGQYGFLDVGYLRVGDTPEVDFRNALSYGVGYGQAFAGGKYSVLVYYAGYSQILAGFDPPRQVTLGSNYKLNSASTLNGGLAFGLSDTTPDFGIFFGVSAGL